MARSAPSYDVVYYGSITCHTSRHILAGTTCLTLPVEYGFVCFMRVSSCQGSPSFSIMRVLRPSGISRIRFIHFSNQIPCSSNVFVCAIVRCLAIRGMSKQCPLTVFLESYIHIYIYIYIYVCRIPESFRTAGATSPSDSAPWPPMPLQPSICLMDFHTL